VAFFRSTTWKLVVAADFAAVILSVALYIFTKSIFAFAPAVLMGLVFTFTIVRVASQRWGAPNGGEDPLVR
jgi:hypothetical protein